jgi:hypothetical protein
MIKMNFSSLKETKPSEYTVRFLFGGVCAVVAGLAAKRYGPTVGGLFLAFPAIFPAGASLIESHEKRRKAEFGFDGTIRGRAAAGIDSAGAAVGCIGLALFALVLWRGIPAHNAYGIISVAALVWMLVSTALWAVRRRRLFHRGRRHL